MMTFTVTFQVLNQMISYTVSAMNEKSAMTDAEGICRKNNNGRGVLVGCKRGSDMPKGAINGANLKKGVRRGS